MRPGLYRTACGSMVKVTRTDSGYKIVWPGGRTEFVGDTR